MPSSVLSESAAAIILVMESIKQQEEIEMIPMTKGKGFPFLYDSLWTKTQSRDVEEARNATYGVLIEYGILQLSMRSDLSLKFKFQEKNWGRFLMNLQGECEKLPSLGINVKHKNKPTESWNIRLVERIDEKLVTEAYQVLKDGKMNNGSIGKYLGVYLAAYKRAKDKINPVSKPNPSSSSQPTDEKSTSLKKRKAAKKNEENDQNKKHKASNDVTMLIDYGETGPIDENMKTIQKLRNENKAQEIIIERLIGLNTLQNKKMYELEKIVDESLQREKVAFLRMQRDYNETMNLVRTEQSRLEQGPNESLRSRTLKESIVIHKNQLLCDALKATCKGYLGLDKRGTRISESKRVLDTIACALRYGLEELDLSNYPWLENGNIPIQQVWSIISNDLGFSYRIQSNTERAINQIRSNDELTFLDFDRLLNRKERKDCIQTKAKIYVEMYSHNDNNGHRPDSNGGDPVEINGEKHPIRIWEDMTTWDEKYEDFKASEEYKQFKELNPDQTIGKTNFRKFVCPCLKDPKLESCVDLILTQVEECARAIDRALKEDREFKRKLDTCTCYLHRTFQYNKLFKNVSTLSSHCSFVPIEELVRGKTVRGIIKNTCCPAVPDEDLACGHEASKRVPSFIPWSCINDAKLCQGCLKKQPMRHDICHTYMNNLRTYRCLVWTRVEIENSSSMQEELKEKEMTFSELIDFTMKKIKDARIHYVKGRWNQHARDLIMEMLDPKKGVALFTDFAATVNLRAKMTDNSSVDSHALIQVFYKFSNRRIVPYEKKKDGSTGEHLLLNTDVTQYFGSTHSKGKSNDWVFATRALLHEIDKHEKKREIQYKKDSNGDYILDSNTGERIQLPFTYWVSTDGAPTQYKCRQHFIFIASIQERFPGRNIRIVHIVASKSTLLQPRQQRTAV